MAVVLNGNSTGDTLERILDATEIISSVEVPQMLQKHTSGRLEPGKIAAFQQFPIQHHQQRIQLQEKGHHIAGPVCLSSSTRDCPHVLFDIQKLETVRCNRQVPTIPMSNRHNRQTVVTKKIKESEIIMAGVAPQVFPVEIDCALKISSILFLVLLSDTSKLL